MMKLPVPAVTVAASERPSRADAPPPAAAHDSIPSPAASVSTSPAFPSAAGHVYATVAVVVAFAAREKLLEPSASGKVTVPELPTFMLAFEACAPRVVRAVAASASSRTVRAKAVRPVSAQVSTPVV